MTVHTAQFAGFAVLVTGVWLAVYRLPLRTPRMRQRFRLAMSSRTGLPVRYVFPIFGTVIYLVSGRTGRDRPGRALAAYRGSIR